MAEDSTAVTYSIPIDCSVCRSQNSGCPGTCVYKPVRVTYGDGRAEHGGN